MHVFEISVQMMTGNELGVLIASKPHGRNSAFERNKRIPLLLRYTLEIEINCSAYSIFRVYFSLVQTSDIYSIKVRSRTFAQNLKSPNNHHQII
jgi:hypothetical protein